MKCLKYLVVVLIALYPGLGQSLNAQPLQKYNNSIRLQMGLFQYNENTNDFIFQNSNNFLSTGLTYRREMSRIFALNLTGRYNEWNMNKSMNLETYAFQVLWVVHTNSISSSWRTNRITPYAGLGVGYEKHDLTTMGNDTVYQRVYIPFEVGLLFNVSPRWSIGIFSEYKLASVSPLDNMLESPKMRLDLSNVAGVSLSYSFGSNKKEQSVPVIRTNQVIMQSRVLDKDIVDSTVVSVKEDVADSTMVSLKKVKDSSDLFWEGDVADSTMVLPEEKDEDSTIVWSDNKIADDLFRPDSTNNSKIYTPATPDSSALQKSPAVFSGKAGVVSDTIRVPVILDISINTQNWIMDNNYMVASANRIQPPEKRYVTSRAPAHESPDRQMQGHIVPNDYDISALKEQNRLQNSRIEAELKQMKLMLGVLNAELLLLSAAKTKTPDKEMESRDFSTPAVKMDSLVYLFDSLDNQLGIDSLKLILASTNVSLLAEVRKLQSENKELTDKLARQSQFADSNRISDSLDNIIYTINFAVNSTKVDIGQLVQLKPLLDLLKNKPEHKLLLSGYADKSGNANYNMSLSKKRVLAVKDELIKMGVNKTRIMEQYFGSEKATAVNNKDDRKVELKLMKSF
ncbi:MAG: OmpA family protein [Lentimicrobium sp.]|jgi:outer membrane protein OmpA-like peptidoglycan-associated protein|nr:OmpA family protein [Lentimicrobium sp.]